MTLFASPWAACAVCAAPGSIPYACRPSGDRGIAREQETGKHSLMMVLQRHRSRGKFPDDGSAKAHEGNIP